jgi:hypothetical protein
VLEQRYCAYETRSRGDRAARNTARHAHRRAAAEQQAPDKVLMRPII